MFVCPRKKTFEEVFKDTPHVITLADSYQDVFLHNQINVRSRTDAMPQSYPVLIRPVRYQGVILNFDVERDFNSELAQILVTL